MDVNPAPEATDGAPTRRRLLTTLAAGAGAAALPALAGCTTATSGTTGTAAAQPTGSPSGSTSPGTADRDAAPGAMQLFDDPDFNFQALFALGAAGEGATEVGETLTAVNAVNQAGVNNQSYTETFRSWGDRLAEQAQGAGEDDEPQTQGFRALRSSAYYEQALYFVLGSAEPDHEQRLYQAGRDSFDTFARTLTPPAVTATLPYGDARMPLWFFRPEGATGRRPTVILTNGSDGQNVDMWTYGVAEALRRDWNALVYDGPGQGQLLFVDGVPFTPRWERVVTPIVDWLTARDDVNPDRIALTGFSLGGVLAPRAAAFERRLAAVVAGPGVVAPWNAFPSEIREVLAPTKEETNRIWNDEAAPDIPKSDYFTLNKRFEPYDAAVMRQARQGELFTDFWTPARVLVDMDISKVAGRIQCPALVVDFEDDQFFPGQARTLYDLIRSDKDYVEMTRAQGAQLHCSPMAPQYYCETVFDWLQQKVRG
ncbi:S9 family peptidase [Streptomyces sp. ODS05-4]|uniref:alpha/beta hydrolase family protein n=1 Tax=Streptomyces sp. ODS05-4 TaxID=2944939 RepID=UPI002109E383|nr:alpha/beta hydrolase [Streptomyces sp. ODS05-4]